MYSVSLMRCSLRTANQYFLQPVRKFKSKRTLELEKPQKAKTVEPIKIEGIVKESKNINPIPKSNVGIGRHIIYTAVSIPVFFTGCAIWHYEEVKRKKSQYTSYYRTNPQRVYAVLASLNLVVFLLWKVPSLKSHMTRFFLCLPTKAHSVTSLTLSAFSHISPIHGFLNMYVLFSFFQPICRQLGHEEAIAVYLAGGTFAGLTSCIYRAMSGRMIPSLGASGAILTFLAIFCMMNPDARLGIAFVNEIIPHSFSAGSALLGLIVLDCVGLLRGWRVLDHAAHLGGVMFGLFYMQYGYKWSVKFRHEFWRQYSKIREGGRK